VKTICDKKLKGLFRVVCPMLPILNYNHKKEFRLGLNAAEAPSFILAFNVD
jgi:hypothetical protein